MAMTTDQQPIALEWDEWFAALQDPGVSIRFVTYGYLPMVRDWRFDGRRVPELLVYRVLENELVAETAGQRFRVHATGTCVVPPGAVHTFGHADRRAPVSLQYFRIELASAGRLVQLVDEPMVLEAAPDLGEDFERLHDDFQSDIADRSARIRASLVLLLSSVRRLTHAEAQQRGTLTASQRAQVYRLVREQRSTRLQPEALAAHLDLSLDYFSRLFRQTYGMPPRQWLVRERIRHAANQLDETVAPISEIGHLLGYPDVYQFSRQFKQVIGVSPRAYRQR